MRACGWRKVMTILCTQESVVISCVISAYLHMKTTLEPPDPCARVRPCVPCVSRVCPGSPRCLFTGKGGLREVLNFASVCRDLPGYWVFFLYKKGSISIQDIIIYHLISCRYTLLFACLLA